MSPKVLEVFLGGPDGMQWTESFENIAKARCEHFATKGEVSPTSEQHSRLMEVCMKDSEVLDWARRFVAPEKIRRSWYLCQITVKNGDGEVMLGIVDNKNAPNPRVATLEAENAKLKAELAKATAKGEKAAK